ncbi:MAG: hypothetical protein OEZ02_06470 [Anaerolineae bacterium]|nr:hypothetical protein [Anaerolineae bacterium]
MMKIIKMLINGFLPGISLIILAGCAAQSQVTSHAPSPTWPVTNTVLPPTLTSYPIQYPEDFSVAQECISLAAAENNNFMSGGSLILYNWDTHENYILEHSSLTPQLLLDGMKNVDVPASVGIRSLDVSPYDRTLHWRTDNRDSNEIYAEFLTPSLDHLKFRLPEKTMLSTWLTDGRVMFSVFSALGDNEVEGQGTIDEFYVLSLHTGELTYYSVNLPMDIIHQDNFLVYHPSLSRVMISNPIVDGKSSFRAGLWDIQNEKFLWLGGGNKLSPGVSGPQRPNWQLDGSQAVYVLDTRELISVSINGEQKILTNFYTVFGSSENTILFPRWSPTGRYISFQYYGSGPGRNSGDYFMDTQTNTVYDYCLHKDIISGGIKWSPKGDQVIFIPEDKSGLVIVNLPGGEVHNMAVAGGVETLALIGWVPWTLP